MLNLGLSIPSHRPRPASGATGILDAFPGAAFAIAPDTLLYGNHNVTDNAAGSQTNGQADTYTVRVRRSSDNAVRSFNHTEVSNGTLVAWVGTGNDGFVEAAYDQSGNGNHATQSTAARQPKIVDAGNLIVENGKVMLDRTTDNTLMETSYDINGANRHVFFVGFSDYSNNQAILLGAGAGGNSYVLVNEATDTNSPISSHVSSVSLRLNSVAYSPANRDAVHSDFLTQKLFSAQADFAFVASGEVRMSIGYRPSNPVGFGMFDTQLLVIYESAQNSAIIENAINNEYNIY